MRVSPTPETIGKGYWRAVAAATLTLVSYTLLGAGLGRHGIHEYAIMGPMLFVVVAFVMYVTALLPFLLVRWVAKALAIRTAWYFLLCGALIGTALCILTIAVLPYPAYDEATVPSFAEQFATGAPIFAFSGALGALVYWWKTGRHFGQHSLPVRRLPSAHSPSAPPASAPTCDRRDR